MTRLRVIVTGLIGSIPIAGLTAHYIQYVTGLRKLGHEVLYLEDAGMWCYDPDTDSMVADSRPGIHYLANTMATFDLADNWRFVDHNGEVAGVDGGAFASYVRDADLFINVTGAGLLRPELMAIERRMYVDTDPGFVQIRAAQGSIRDLDHLQMHTHFATFGANIGGVDCSIPTLDLPWIPTRQPIDVDLWPIAEPPKPGSPFTSIVKWQTYDPVEYEGRTFGLKDVEFARFVDLPGRVAAPFVLAQAGLPPLPGLERLGWERIEGRSISRDLDTYRSFITNSLAEWSIAKNAYVDLRSGWFGDRSAAYLAMGRPVVAQATGFERWLPTGSGLHAFSTMEECVAAIDEVIAAYPSNRLAARDIALQEFSAEGVLGRLIEAAA